MISWVNPKISIKSGGEKGNGSFANAPISRDEIMVVQGGRILDYKYIKTSDYEPFHDHCFQVEKDLLICPIEPKREKLDGIFQINHSCDPNCGFRGQIALIAMRNIQTGEEITYDYAMTDANWNSVACTKITCLCNAENCRRVISGEDWRRKDLQEKCGGYFSTFIQELIKQNY
ncbi:MAG: SET domain-containing protein-lysine N-methyltransferase [Patescibacteria group bacterium]